MTWLLIVRQFRDLRVIMVSPHNMGLEKPAEGENLKLLLLCTWEPLCSPISPGPPHSVSILRELTAAAKPPVIELHGPTAVVLTL